MQILFNNTFGVLSRNLKHCQKFTSIFNKQSISSFSPPLDTTAIEEKQQFQQICAKQSAQLPTRMSKTKIQRLEENVVKSPNDPKDYRVIQLQNGLKVLLISDKESAQDCSNKDEEKQGEKLAAASLCVGVGSFSDPPELPGLAHFLEHMVFMGSGKYPNENEFDEFVKKHGGMNNAYTECEHTVFYFNIEKTAFQKGLDIFAGFFANPLMKQTSVDREIKAVDSEFCMSKPRDNPRLEQLLASTAKQGHPMGKFTWGNITSLKETPSKQGIDLYAKLREFHVASYSAEYMTLVVQAIYPLDTLEEWATESFSAVPINGKPRPTFYDLKEPFDTKEHARLYKMIPCQNKHRLVITWSLPTLLEHYQAKPLHYLGFLVGHEGKGSIMAYLRRKMLANDLEGGNAESGFEHNMTQAGFSITIELTEDGFEDYNEVILVVMEYMKMLQKEGPKEWIYNEIKSIEDNSFRWMEEMDPIDYVESVAPNMLHYPVEEYFTGDKLYTKYDPKLITECINRLQPDNANITVVSKKFLAENICDQKETWFKTPYCVQDISPDLIKKWKETEPRSELHLPEPNVFIATDFSLKEALNHSEYPVSISDAPVSRLWYKQDVKFKIPKANANFLLISPAIKKSATSLCMLDLMLLTLEHQMTETAYAASVANLGYALKREEHGLVILVSGFNHKLLKLFETIVDFIAGISLTQELLDTLKKQLEKDYYNKSIKPSQLNKDMRMSVMRQNEKTLVDCQLALPTITVDMVTAFVKEITSAVYVEGLVQGNLTAQEAKEFETYILTKLDCQPITGGNLPQTIIIDLPVGDLYVRADNLNPNDENSVICNYYQHGPCDYHQLSLNDLLIMRMEEPCFDILRTREQLGYSVYPTSRLTDGILGFTISVCSQAQKFDLEKLDEHIEKFLEEFKEMLEKDTEDDFNTLRNSLITLKLCADSNLSEEMSRNWSQVLDRSYHFDTQKRMVTELKALSLEDLRIWFKVLVGSGGKSKKLSIQVEGHKNAAKDTEQAMDIGEKPESDVGSDLGSASEEEDMDDDGGFGDEEGLEDEEEGEDVEQPVESYTFKDLEFKPVAGKPASSVIMSVKETQQKFPFYPFSKLT